MKRLYKVIYIISRRLFYFSQRKIAPTKSLTELTTAERIEMNRRICNSIIGNITVIMQNKRNGDFDLSDIGNEIGRAVGACTCEKQKDKNIFAFEKDDFIVGFEHGYSLQDGTHG